MINGDRKRGAWKPRVGTWPSRPPRVEAMTVDPLSRARAIARAFPMPCAASGRHGGITFGAPRNAGKAPVTFDEAEFATMTDAQVMARLHSAWGEP